MTVRLRFSYYPLAMVLYDLIHPEREGDRLNAALLIVLSLLAGVLALLLAFAGIVSLAALCLMTVTLIWNHPLPALVVSAMVMVIAITLMRLLYEKPEKGNPR